LYYANPESKLPGLRGVPIKKDFNKENQDNVIDALRADISNQTINRRKIAALAAVGLVDFSLISLFQMGYLKTMPDLPGKLFDSEKVNSSKDAILLGMPDGVFSLCAYAGTMFLAVAASRKSKYARFFDFVLGGVILGQAAGGTYYLYNMATVQKKVCIYCVAGACINFAAVKSYLSIIIAKD